MTSAAGGGAEIMTPVTKPEAVALAEIHAMRQVADTLKALGDTIATQGRAQTEHTAASTRAMEKLSEKVDGMNARLIRLEEQKHGREIDALRKDFAALAGKVDTLEAAQDRRTGMASVGGWLSRSAPWLMTAAAAILAALGWSRGGG